MAMKADDKSNDSLWALMALVPIALIAGGLMFWKFRKAGGGKGIGGQAIDEVDVKVQVEAHAPTSETE